MSTNRYNRRNAAAEGILVTGVANGISKALHAMQLAMLIIFGLPAGIIASYIGIHDHVRELRIIGPIMLLSVFLGWYLSKKIR